MSLVCDFKEVFHPDDGYKGLSKLFLKVRVADSL